jgi:cell migration-inducing and hyaluronan-binding protein
MAVSLLGSGSGLAAQDHHAHGHADAGAGTPPSAVKTVRWSDPAAWPDGKVPREGDEVTIARDTEVILDVNAPALRSLTVDGKLTFSDERDIALESEWIYLRGGALQIGSEDRPHTRKATITLTNRIPDENINTMGDRGIMLMRGTLQLHGDRENAWTKLAKTAEAGSARIEVLDAAGWREGDEIVLASTDFDPRQAERRTVAAIVSNSITLDRPLEYMHFGAITFGVDQRGEVGLLTRNIRIQASEDANTSYFGGHIMAMPGSTMKVSGVELNRMGQHLTLARYPIHWHIAGDGSGQYIRNSAIHDTYSRCVTVHGTDNLRVENNVTFNTVGHCFFMEDGIESGNQFVRNLGIQTKCHPTLPCEPTNLAPFRVAGGKNFLTAGQKSEHVLLPSDTASTFWITNPNNIYRDNVAAGSDQIGFWIALPEHPTGAFEGTEISKVTWPRRTTLREFKGNVAHSNFDGLMGDRGPRPDGTFATAGHIALADPADANSPQVERVIEDFTSYKNRNGGLWVRGELTLIKNLKVADNAIGYTHASANLGRSDYTSRVVDSLFVGESENIGNPRTATELAYGRSLPDPELADFPIRGYEFYDYRHELNNVTFVNFEDNDTRKTGAISYLLFTSFGASTNNTIEGAKFVNAKPVYFPPIEHKWSNDDYGNASWRNVVFQDVDGSVTGVPNSFILNNDEEVGIAIDDACEVKPTWNAAVCTGDYGRLVVGGAPPIPGFGAIPGAGPAAGAAAGGSGTAPQPPVMLSRQGKEFAFVGETNVRAGTEIKVITERDTVDLRLSELERGSWVVFELPGFTTAALGTPQESLEALRTASTTSYHRDGDALWVKVVSTGEGARLAGPGAGATTVQVSRNAGSAASAQAENDVDEANLGG